MQSYTVKTPNFTYVLHVDERDAPIHKIDFRVGDPHQPCLEGSLLHPNVDERLRHLVHIASLHKIDALEQCALEYASDKSFGTELLYSFLNILRVNFPHIREVRFADSSYIPCNRETHDNLDLLTYSIALYGKTWYEMRANARLSKKEYQTKYEAEIANYISPSTKASIPFSHILGDIALGNFFAHDYITRDIQIYENMYNNSDTFPDFFKTLSNAIPREQRCAFFKGWLEYFIGSYVAISRDWIIDIDANPILKNVLNASKSRPMGTRNPTRKAHRTYNVKNMDLQKT
jgi:hypothetical protein